MTVANSVVLDTDVHVAGVVIEPGATLSFDPGKTITLESTGNVVVRGRWPCDPMRRHVTASFSLTSTRQCSSAVVCQ